MTGREAALRTLMACEVQGAWADGCLKRTLRQGGVTGREAALATQLTFGVAQNRLLLDWRLGALSRRPLEKLEPAVRAALRLGAYQLLLLDKIPASAAVNESVKLTRAFCKSPAAAGMVNAILRSLERGKGSMPPPPTLSLQYSHPQWLVDAFSVRLGEEASQLLACHNRPAPTVAQVNLCKASPEQVRQALAQEGVEAEMHPWLPGCLVLGGTGSLEGLRAFQEGLLYIQDAAARMAVLAAGLSPGMRVLDACAAPGGKSFAAAVELEDRGEVISCDIHPHKVELLRLGAQRLELACIRPQLADARRAEPRWEEGFDAVIADVPCSGLGVIRKKPDIRYKDPKPLEGLPAVQEAIVNNVCRCVRPGGVLLYATCTLLERENEAIVRRFCQTHPAFVPEGFQLPGPVGEAAEGMLTLWPHRHDTDGFFIAKLRRVL